MSSIQLKDLDKYIQKFDFSEKYSKLCLEYLNEIFTPEEDLYLYGHTWKREKTGRITAPLDSVVERLDKFNEEYKTILDSMLAHANELNVFDIESLFHSDSFDKPAPKKPNNLELPYEPHENQIL